MQQGTSVITLPGSMLLRFGREQGAPVTCIQMASWMRPARYVR